jgi:hypothetical protein
VKRAYEENITALLDRFRALPTGTPTHEWHRCVALSEEAELLRRAFAAELEPRLGPHGDLAPIRAWGAKLAGASVRLSGVLHLADDPDDATPWEKAVSEEEQAHAIELARYFLEHARAAFDAMGLDAGTGDARAVLEWVVANRKERLTEREAFTALVHRFEKMDRFSPVLADLEERGYLYRVPWVRPEGRTGRAPSPTFLVNPAAFRPPGRAPAAEPAEPAELGRPERRATDRDAAESAAESAELPTVPPDPPTVPPEAGAPRWGTRLEADSEGRVWEVGR